MFATLKTFALATTAALAFTGLSAPDAAAGHSSVHVNVNLGHASFGYAHGPRPYVPYRPYRPVCAPVYYAPLPVYCAAPVYCPQPVYVPVWHVENQQVWIDPVYQTVLTGYDTCGRPTYGQVCVSQGYWRTAQYRVSDRGARVFVCYL